ncbi:hypothetical protein F2P56_000208 [Juglans regia]|uniref:PPM-type phosphatase domain-containing protein n=2 Tax=Juglans regia TaxID=51240 RepID=A0A833YAC3_JUGRE|nr:probable protein phosphatase 2C 2 [Juglans regia]KAF5479377.1 hypothetical protein F2P56_000208 [Juglans regia]
MALTLTSPSHYHFMTPLSRVGNIFVGRKGGSSLIFESLNPEISKNSTLTREESPRGDQKLPRVTCQQENPLQEYIGGLGDQVDATRFYGERAQDKSGILMIDIPFHEEKIMQENKHHIIFQKGIMHDMDTKDQNSSALVNDQGSDSFETTKFGGVKAGALKSRKRPARLVVPAAYCPEIESGEMGRKLENKEFEVEGRNFVLASRKGRRMVMEDGYGAMLDILGDPKQALFAVIDGHGGHAAADYVAKNLGRNIVEALDNVGEEDDQLEKAIRKGYSVTDEEFLSQEISSGACVASVLLKDGELHVASAGDCRVVLSREGLATVLTNDHRPSREDERLRIQNSGGFVHCRNGVWRVQGSLAVSRAIGDLHLKDWVISEPDIKSLRITSDYDFLIMASDGLWDKVNDQEAVDVVSREKNLLKSCKQLVDISCSRGNIDDITVMVINLQYFAVSGSC